ncbi:hypothetical protein ACHAWF_006207, partial [Thalassiosira exigua]
MCDAATARQNAAVIQALQDMGPKYGSIRQEFLTVLLDVPPDYIGGEFRKTLAMSVRNGDIGVRNPIATAVVCLKILGVR